MTLKRKVVLAVSAAVVLIGAVAVAYVVATTIFWSDMCGNDRVVELPSPDRELKAVTFRRNCGATTGYSTHLSVVEVNEQIPNDGGNVLVLGGEPEVAVTWRSRRHLVIVGVAAAEIYKREARIGDVEIAYK